MIWKCVCPNVMTDWSGRKTNTRWQGQGNLPLLSVRVPETLWAIPAAALSRDLVYTAAAGKGPGCRPLDMVERCPHSKGPTQRSREGHPTERPRDRARKAQGWNTMRTEKGQDVLDGPEISRGLQHSSLHSTEGGRSLQASPLSLPIPGCSQICPVLELCSALVPLWIQPQ